MRIVCVLRSFVCVFLLSLAACSSSRVGVPKSNENGPCLTDVDCRPWLQCVESHCHSNTADGDQIETEDTENDQAWDYEAIEEEEKPPVVTQIETSSFRTCALTKNGRIYCWGHNGEGGLGGSAIVKKPALVRGLVQGVTKIAVGIASSCLLTDVKTVYCWGAEGLLLGFLATEICEKSTNPSWADWLCAKEPKPVLGLTDIDDLFIGGSTASAINRAGLVYRWGYNEFGELGDGSTNDQMETKAITGLPEKVTAIAESLAPNACALTSSGDVYCWGYNKSGELGFLSSDTCREELETIPCAKTPQKVLGLPAPAQAVSSGIAHHCALMVSGEIYCWGYNYAGALGDGTTDDHFTPRLVKGLPTERIERISAGGWHTCALTQTGVAYCWGRNDEGQLGVGRRDIDKPQTIPQTVLGINEALTAISASKEHTCALAASGTVYCWGSNAYYQLGREKTCPHYDCFETMPQPVIW